MTIYLQTARLRVSKQYAGTVWKRDAIFFATRGWAAFAALVLKGHPEVEDLLLRLERPVDDYPQHATYSVGGAPLDLLWTTDECRRLFLALTAFSNNATETAYDFWEFLALICCGINEEGICTF